MGGKGQDLAVAGSCLALVAAAATWRWVPSSGKYVAGKAAPGGSAESGLCSALCNEGVATSTRQVVTSAAYGGAACPALSQVVPCNTQPCEVDCQLSGFSSWGTCSRSCGGGIMHASRLQKATSHLVRRAQSSRHPRGASRRSQVYIIAVPRRASIYALAGPRG